MNDPDYHYHSWRGHCQIFGDRNSFHLVAEMTITCLYTSDILKCPVSINALSGPISAAGHDETPSSEGNRTEVEYQPTTGGEN